MESHDRIYEVSFLNQYSLPSIFSISHFEMALKKVKTGAGHNKAGKLNSLTRDSSTKGLMSNRAIKELQAQSERERIERLSSMSDTERKELEYLCDLHCPIVREDSMDDNDWENIGDIQPMDLDDVLSGKARNPLSFV